MFHLLNILTLQEKQIKQSKKTDDGVMSTNYVVIMFFIIFDQFGAI